MNQFVNSRCPKIWTTVIEVSTFDMVDKKTKDAYA